MAPSISAIFGSTFLKAKSLKFTAGRLKLLKASEAFYSALVKDNFQCQHHMFFLKNQSLELLFVRISYSDFA